MKTIPSIPLSAVLAGALLFSGQTSASDPHTVESGVFRKTVTIDGWFAPNDVEPVSVEPEEWSSLVLLDLLPHGTPVAEGDVIAVFDTESLEDRIEDLERTADNRATTLRRLELEVEALRETTPLNLAAAIRNHEEAVEALEYWNTTSRELSVSAAEQAVVSAEQSLYLAREELRQLQIMYEADDLVEETEEIILRRTQWAVDRAELSLDRVRKSSERTLEVELPRRDRSLAETVERTRIERTKAEEDYVAFLAQKEFELAEARRNTEESAEQLENLRADLALLSGVEAPAQGRLLWGDWTEENGPARFAEFERKYRNNSRGAIAARDRFATIATGGMPVQLVGNLPQAERSAIGWRGGAGEETPGTPRHASIEAVPDFAFPVRLSEVTDTPDTGGNFAVRVETDKEAIADDSFPPITPGMKARLTLVDYLNEEAIAIPQSMVRSRFDGTSMIHEVRVLPPAGDEDEAEENANSDSNADKGAENDSNGDSNGDSSEEGREEANENDDKPEPEVRMIRLGHRSGDRVEVVDGLSEGERLVAWP